MRNLYEQQASNKRNTVLVMVVFILFLSFLGCGADAFILQAGFPFVTFIALAVGFGSSMWSLNSGAQAVLRASAAVPVSPGDPRYHQLLNVVDEMSIASGLPRPQVYVIPDPDPNAFATGKDPHHAHVAVTEGLLTRLSRDELQGVIAHEIAHIKNYDIRMMTVVAALIGAVMLLSQVGMRSSMYGGRRKSSDRSGGSGNALVFILWIVAMILAPFISQILAMAVSRQREYLADASGAELTRNPGALASALEKIDGAADPTRSIKKGVAHLCIADPLGRSLNAREGAFADLFATHPPIQKRIAILRGMSYKS